MLFRSFLKNAVHEDIDHSFFYQKPAMDVILDKAPATLELVFASSVLIIFLSIPVGIFCAIAPKNFFSRLAMGASIVGISIPVFFTAIMLIYIFSIFLITLTRASSDVRSSIRRDRD